MRCAGGKGTIVRIVSEQGGRMSESAAVDRTAPGLPAWFIPDPCCPKRDVPAVVILANLYRHPW